ncbi:MAG: 7-cyano-7-deazaguanine synthase QueC [Candidatus Omnitrophica bacterium]|nr:7-cyano-7-deazaguanine synthase QueC [Candidatus Omnitrophota bacterium]
MKKAVILLSGGLDSTTTLYLAKRKGFKCYCLIFDYGQRHRKEIRCAELIAKRSNFPYKIIKIQFPWKGSALLEKNKKILKHCKQRNKKEIPSTYVPARNIIFLSFALSYAEAINAEAIFIGAHIQDYPGYPDCRPQFFRAFKEIIIKGSKTGVEQKRINIFTPLINKTKAEIIKLAKQLNVPLELTWSCYQGKRKPCRRCDSCYYRAKGFKEAGIKDPLLR